MGNKFSTIKERVLQIAKHKGLSKAPFVESLGMTYGNFTGKAKETPLNSEAISNLLLLYPDVNPDWLLTGQGEMLRPSPPDDLPGLEETFTGREVWEANERVMSKLLAEKQLYPAEIVDAAMRSKDDLIEQLKKQIARLEQDIAEIKQGRQ